MASPNRTIRRKEITELARQTWLRIWSDQMPKDWRVYLVRKTVIQRVHGRSVLRRSFETGQDNSGGSPHQTLQLPNARARTRASPNTGRTARPRTRMELRVQSRGAAAVRQRASNGHMTSLEETPFQISVTTTSGRVSHWNKNEPDSRCPRNSTSSQESQFSAGCITNM